VARCPKCGATVPSPKKKWTMAGRPDSSGKRIVLEIGLFDCPRCRRPFREVLSKRKVTAVDNTAQSGRVCGSCGYSNPINYQFCGKCGTPLADVETQMY
jgi:ribosomal protein L40E